MISNERAMGEPSRRITTLRMLAETYKVHKEANELGHEKRFIIITSHSQGIGHLSDLDFFDPTYGN